MEDWFDTGVDLGGQPCAASAALSSYPALSSCSFGTVSGLFPLTLLSATKVGKGNDPKIH